MSTGEAEDSQWRGHPLCNDIPRLRELRRSIENLPVEIPRSKPSILVSLGSPSSVHIEKIYLNN